MENLDSNQAVLEAADVNVPSAWGGRIEVSGVAWTVLPGEYWVVGGAHGSGKTDLLLTVAGLRRAAGGSVRIFGKDVTELSEKELLQQRARIGFVFKGGGRMFSDLTVAENVALPLCYHRDWAFEQARDEVRAVLAATELTPLANETAQTLGADWQQRVGLARALALKPEVIFFDEPAAGLDARHRQWWREFMAGLAAENPAHGGKRMTVIAATNDFALWYGGRHRYAMIKGQRWCVLGEKAQNPELE